MDRKAKNKDAVAVIAAINMSNTENKSTAMTMPKGAGHPPNW